MTETEWNELEKGIKDAMTAIPIAMPSVSQSSGSGRVGTGNVSSGSNGIPSQVVFLLCTP
jgi:hypothetical protein